MTDVLLRRCAFQSQAREWIPRFREAEEILSVAERLRKDIAALCLEVMRKPLLSRNHQAVVGRIAVAEVRPYRTEQCVRTVVAACRRHVEESGMVRISHRLVQVCIRLAKQAVSKYALVSHAVRKRISDLPLKRKRAHIDVRILDRRRNRPDSSEVGYAPSGEGNQRCRTRRV